MLSPSTLNKNEQPYQYLKVMNDEGIFTMSAPTSNRRYRRPANL